MNNLKSCPFCNIDVDYYNYDMPISGLGRIVIFCDNCNLTMEDSYVLEEYIRKNSRDSYEQVSKRLFVRWDTRKG